MRLFIAEKPSVGRALAEHLQIVPGNAKGYYKTKGGIVTWLFGHVLRQAEPDEYDEKYKKWNARDLPIIPTKWRLLVSDTAKNQFQLVKELIQKADEIIHAGDPDREGQLLVDEVLEYVGCKKMVKRLLLNALDEKSIRTALASLRDNREFFYLGQSALARARADWIIGMNLSRAYTLAGRSAGHQGMVFPIGRVKTPTMSLVVRRENEIESFVPTEHYHIKAVFEHEKGSFTAQWKPKEEQLGLDNNGRLIDLEVAKARLEEFNAGDRAGYISLFSHEKKQEPQRLLFSLSSLQVLAGKKYSYSPQEVLDILQVLYEKKLTTYPRSDCEYLPESQYGDAKEVLEAIELVGDSRLSHWCRGANLQIKSRAWNDKKISAHHGIIPTAHKEGLKGLSKREKDIYFLLAQAYLAQFYPIHSFYQTKLEVSYQEELFSATGKTIIQQGWKELYLEDKKSSKGEEEKEVILPPVEKGDRVQYLSGEIGSKVTKPPSRFTQSTLIAAMKDIHKFVKNPEAKKQLKAVYGIGTEATRATILKELIEKRGLLQESGNKKQLKPSKEARLLTELMPEELKYPDFTAIWEDRLHSLAKGEGSLEEFLTAQVDFAKKMCKKAEELDFPRAKGYACPGCKRGVLLQKNGRNGIFWGCSAFPACKTTFNDSNGHPDMAKREKRENIARQEKSAYGSYSYNGSAAEYAELGAFGAPEWQK